MSTSAKINPAGLQAKPANLYREAIEAAIAYSMAERNQDQRLRGFVTFLTGYISDEDAELAAALRALRCGGSVPASALSVDHKPLAGRTAP